MRNQEENAPVCCSLPEPDARVRRTELADGLARRVTDVRELDDGYALRFEAAPGMAEELGRFIEFERACCAFLNFTLRVAKGAGPIWLEMTGSAEAKDFLRPDVERWTPLRADRSA